MFFPEIALRSKCIEDGKKEKVDVKPPLVKSGTSYPATIKQKIISELKLGFHRHRTATKIYGISINTINSWVIQDSLFSLTSIVSTQSPMKQATSIKLFKVNIIRFSSCDSSCLISSIFSIINIAKMVDLRPQHLYQRGEF